MTENPEPAGRRQVGVRGVPLVERGNRLPHPRRRHRRRARSEGSLTAIASQRRCSGSTGSESWSHP